MHLRMERTIAAPATIAWQILGPEFADIADWATFVRKSKPLSDRETPEGMSIASGAPVPGRETTTKATLREFIVAYDPEQTTLTFDADGLPPVVRLARNVQSVVPTGPTSSTLVFEIDFDFIGPFELLSPIMRRRMEKSLGGVMDDLRAEAERRHLQP